MNYIVNIVDGIKNPTTHFFTIFSFTFNSLSDTINLSSVRGNNIKTIKTHRVLNNSDGPSGSSKPKRDGWPHKVFVKGKLGKFSLIGVF